MDWIYMVPNFASYDYLAAPSISTSSSAHTKAANYTQLSAALPYDIAGIGLWDWGYTNSANFLLDIAIGAASSEVVIIPNILFGIYNLMVGYPKVQAFFPLNVAAGTRLSANAQSTYAGANGLGITCFVARRGGFLSPAPFSGVDTYGSETADTSGLSIDPGGSAGTYSSWVQLSAATPRAYKAYKVILGNQSNVTRNSANWTFQVGYGAEGSEAAICTLTFWVNSATDQIGPVVHGPMFTVIPQGSRLCVRAKCDITDATDRLFDFTMHAFY